MHRDCEIVFASYLGERGETKMYIISKRSNLVDVSNLVLTAGPVYHQGNQVKFELLSRSLEI